MAKRPKKEYQTEKRPEDVFLIVQDERKGFYIAGWAARVPDEYVKNIREYVPKAGDGVFESPRAFIVTARRERNVEQILGGVLPKPK